MSLDSKQWHFEAANSEERDEWVFIIEQEIFKSLQGIESSKPKSQSSNDIALLMQNIRTQVPGNSFCVDCDSPSEYHVCSMSWPLIEIGFLVRQSTRVGEPQPGNIVLHRMFGRSSKPRISHFKSSFFNSRRVAARSLSGDAFNRKRHSEFCVGEQHEGSSETR